jgi:hypothetical protein
MEAILVAWAIAGLFFISLLGIMLVRNAKETRRNDRVVDPTFRLDSTTCILKAYENRLLTNAVATKRDWTCGVHDRSD